MVELLQGIGVLIQSYATECVLVLGNVIMAQMFLVVLHYSVETFSKKV